MASGCTGRTPGDKCLEKVSSNCVTYQGDPIPLLGICTNDTLTEDMEIILNKLIDYSTGVGISLPDITSSCDFITNQLALKDKNLSSLIQILVDSSCSLKTLLDATTATVNTPVIYDGKCLTPSTADTKGYVQALINKVCQQDVTIAAIEQEIQNNSINTTITNISGDTVLAAITSCGGNGIVKTGSGATAAIQFTAMVPLYCPVAYIGPLSNFDSTGKGLSNSGYCGWYIMNGLNGTQDWRGYVPMGATSLPGINSPALDAVIDYSSDASLNVAPNQKVGVPKVKLSISEIPSHTHTVTIPPHHHQVNAYAGGFGAAGGGVQSFSNPGGALNTSDVSLTPTVSSSGGDQKHENRQPSVGTVWIVRLP